MGEVSEVKLYGIWSGSPTKRVELALKLKGIPYEYIEEDLSNKSESLLRYNPVHKMVPVLVHNGKPIAESLVIIQYIDDRWNNTPRLLPEDPYERAKVRFWVNFYDQKFRAKGLVLSQGKEKARIVEELLENLELLEGLKRDFPGEGPFFHGENPGFLDIVMGSSAGNYAAIEEAIGVKSVDPQRHPHYFSWVTALKDHPVVKDTLPPQEKMVELILNYRERFLHVPNSS